MAVTALLLGLAGSLHCLGMCSPLMMAATSRSAQVIANRLVYNAGRILTYSVLGMILASTGLALPLQFQNLLSVVFGVVLLFVAIFGIGKFSVIKVSFLHAAGGKLKKIFAKLIQQKNYGARFLLGSINGLLPCGLTFLALSYCLILQGPADGFFFMLLFGAGTLPVMLGFTGVFQWIIQRLNYNVKNLTAGLLALSGILLIARVFIFHAPKALTMKDHVIDIVICR